ncbi:unnamed protein product [Phytophthora lilii]|uniref:Unnamed protein product n=1 Tax=Phytophthora lilii TaxID=2077276 RepID=A0A9W6TE56_9STRA|nr:unnamed protein product [Phytophthora lilii]
MLMTRTMKTLRLSYGNMDVNTDRQSAPNFVETGSVENSSISDNVLTGSCENHTGVGAGRSGKRTASIKDKSVGIGWYFAEESGVHEGTTAKFKETT